MATRSSDINVRLRLRGQRQFRREVLTAGDDLEAMGLKGAAALGRFASKRDKLKDFGRRWSRGVTLPLLAGAGVAAKFATDWEDAFAGVEKTVDATPAGFERINTGLRNMSMRIPVAATELAGIAEAAGQLGIENKHLLTFTRTMADLAVATNMSSEQAATQLARFANIMKMPQTEFQRLGSVIVDLGNNFATTESEIVELGMRIAGAGTQVGLTEAQVMSISAALSSMGVRAEAGGTAISTSMLKINSAVLSGGAELEAFAKVAGMSGEQFGALWERNAAKGVTAFIQGLDGVRKSGGDMAGTLKDLGLGGIRITDVLGRTSSNTEVLTKALGLGGKAWKKNNALTKEARKRYATFKSMVQVLKNIAINLAGVIGKELIPALKDFVAFAGPKIKGMAEAFGELPKPVKTAAIGVAVLLAVVGPLGWALGALAGGVGKVLMILKLLTKATALFNLTLLANPVVLIVVGIVALVAALVLAYHKVGWFRDAVDGAFGFMKGAVTKVLGFLRSNWPYIVGILLGPVGIAAALIIKNWDKVKAAATGVVNWVKNAFNNVVGFVTGLPGRISTAASGMWDGIKSAFRGAVNWIIDKWNALQFRIGGQEISVLGKSISVPDITLKTPDIPRLAAGGDITQPGVVEVGERGPELLSLPRAARVTPLDPRPIPPRAADSKSGRPIIPVKLLLPNGRVLAETVVDAAEDDAVLGVTG